MRHVNRNVNKAINYVSLDQWFPDFIKHQKYPQGLGKQIARLTPRISDYCYCPISWMEKLRQGLVHLPRQLLCERRQFYPFISLPRE